MPELYVLGAGGHAKVVVATAQACGYIVAGVFDDDPEKAGTELLGIPVQGPIDAALELPPARLLMGIGLNGPRLRVVGRIEASRPDASWATLVHPSATVHDSVQPGAGSVVFAGAVLQPDARVGAHCIVNTGATIDHDSELGDYVHVCPGTHLSGSVRVHSGAWIGLGSSVREGVEIGEGSYIGAGAAVVCDVPAGECWVGVPARMLRTQP